MKNKKLAIISVMVLTVVTLAIIIGYSLYHNKNNIYNVNDIFDIEVLGTEGYGYVNVSVAYEFIEKTGISLDDFSYKISKNNMLSNDDIITITIDDTAKVKLSDNQLEYRISGLENGTDLNIFKDLMIKYDTETKKIVLDNTKCSEFIKANVLFSIRQELDEYNKGDVVEIIGYVDMNAAMDNRYNITKTTYEYIVE